MCAPACACGERCVSVPRVCVCACVYVCAGVCVCVSRCDSVRCSCSTVAPRVLQRSAKGREGVREGASGGGGGEQGREGSERCAGSGEFAASGGAGGMEETAFDQIHKKKGRKLL